LANQLFASYARGVEARELTVILGKEALSDEDLLFYNFADNFEQKFVKQERGMDRSIENTLDIGWQLVSQLPPNLLKRIHKKYIDKFYSVVKQNGKD